MQPHPTGSESAILLVEQNDLDCENDLDCDMKVGQTIGRGVTT